MSFCSSLVQEPQTQIYWRATFQRKTVPWAAVHWRKAFEGRNLQKSSLKKLNLINFQNCETFAGRTSALLGHMRPATFCWKMSKNIRLFFRLISSICHSTIRRATV
jgi:hypothetical protein